MFNNAKLNLTPNETSQVVLVFVVTNNGDAVTGSGLTIAGMPSYVTAVTFSVVRINMGVWYAQHVCVHVYLCVFRHM